MNPLNANDVGMVSIQYLASTGYKPKYFKLKKRVNRGLFIDLQSKLESNPKVLIVKGYTHNGYI